MTLQHSIQSDQIDHSRNSGGDFQETSECASLSQQTEVTVFIGRDALIAIFFADSIFVV